ncbi:hypothetical protein, partial [Pseudoflavonifractor phocaeensis]|uniref:hypothetical protein n=1 Tax=Pseudoflavonifractor phocaeensis TaxID=1870988 RepID=UPI00195C7EB0
LLERAGEDFCPGQRWTSLSPASIALGPHPLQRSSASGTPSLGGKTSLLYPTTSHAGIFEKKKRRYWQP